MDYFSSFRKNIEDFREQAAVAASKARHFAEDFSEKAQGLATVATANARVVAEKLKEDAKGLTEQQHWQDAAEKAKTTLLNLPLFTTDQETTFDERELQAYGITEGYKSFVRSLDYSTFRDFSEDQLHASIGFLVSPNGDLRLNPWQERHALIALQVFSELDHLRYLLCPKRMTEEKFWLVYFSLAQSHLPEGCKIGELPDLASIVPEPSPTTEMDPLFVKTDAKVKDEEEGSDHDDLDKYLNDVLHEDAAGASSKGEVDFEDLDGYMEQLNAEMGSENSQDGLPSDLEVVDSADVTSQRDNASGQTQSQQKAGES